ncbi:hypothetical protein [Egicoccus halophilus]|uniref:Uncharacterized protein n=1 Tax=Egicoccus halophilus TaxID=1670830 RepID=A0A8J3A9G4_9ACTN|nr:hypothetical protein [Egicoccus halophilus]GGI08010.1 hypothetical protein GCM10011354_26940 [Egicoccus halophilus]
MPSLLPLIRRGWAFAPVVVEVARQVEKQVGPHVRAWQLASAVDGLVGRWTDRHGTHWVVFADADAAPLEAFPPLRDADLRRAGEELDRSGLRRHDELPEATALHQLQRVRELPELLARRRGDA